MEKWDFLTGRIRNIWEDILPYADDTQELFQLIYFVQTEKNTKIKYNHKLTLQNIAPPSSFVGDMENTKALKTSEPTKTIWVKTCFDILYESR